jgi:hypothetical protein
MTSARSGTTRPQVTARYISLTPVVVVVVVAVAAVVAAVVAAALATVVVVAVEAEPVVVAAVVVAVANGLATHARKQLVAPKVNANIALKSIGNAVVVVR